MDEAEWLAGVDHQPMLEFLYDRTSDRKTRLFAVACCRRYEHLLTDPRHRNAVAVAERFADGLASGGDLNAAQSALTGSPNERLEDGVDSACFYCCYQSDSYPSGLARGVANDMIVATWRETDADQDYDAACSELAGLVRCLVGNPYAPVAADPAWLTSAVVGLAEAIYAGRRFADLPILADALQEAGCDDAAVLRHCRDGGEHARGCWVVDMVLGKS